MKIAFATGHAKNAGPLTAERTIADQYTITVTRDDGQKLSYAEAIGIVICWAEGKTKNKRGKTGMDKHDAECDCDQCAMKRARSAS